MGLFSRVDLNSPIEQVEEQFGVLRYGGMAMPGFGRAWLASIRQQADNFENYTEASPNARYLLDNLSNGIPESEQKRLGELLQRMQSRLKVAPPEELQALKTEADTFMNEL